MTAEVAIMNKRAVAIAADSAVTITTEKGKKIFTSVNKIFRLSELHPVGIMVFGSAEFMGIPWEIIIKLYRDYLGDKFFGMLNEYSDDFRKFLIKKNKLFLADKYAEQRILDYFKWQILKNIRDELMLAFKKEGEVSNADYRKIVSQVIQGHYEIWSRAPFGQNISERDVEILRKKQGKLITEAKKEVFAKVALTRDSAKKLSDIAIYLSVKFPIEKVARSISGLVIVGFGNEELFPSLCATEVECVIDNLLKYRSHEEAKISRDNPSSIMAFAQRDMVITFMEGVHPGYMRQIEGDLAEILNKFPEFIIDGLTQLNNRDKKKEKERIKTISRKEFDSYKEKLRLIRVSYFAKPVVNAVTVLPKGELAMLAESLVNLTSLKKKVTMDEEETVGGPIDVAIISKEDGFVWVQKKGFLSKEVV